MKKILYLLFFVFAFVISTSAQVTIGSQNPPAPGAVLDLQSTALGFLPPRVALQFPSKPDPLPSFMDGMVVFNTHETDSLVVGLYYCAGSKWIHLSADPYSPTNWFYMPSIVFDTSTNANGLTKNLYQEYKNQLNNTAATSPVIKSANDPYSTVLKTVPGATGFYYYVTAYDPNVFKNISISEDGVMTYDVIGQASDSTLLNIVFVEK